MKKISFDFNINKKIIGYINCVDLQMADEMTRRLIKAMRCTKKMEIQAIEQEFITDIFFNNVEKFIILDDFSIDSNGTIIGKTYENRARLISTCFSMLAKKNKSELDYRDILSQAALLRSELEQPVDISEFTLEKREIHIENPVIWHFSSVTMLALLLKRDLTIGNFCPFGVLKDYLRPVRDASGVLISDVYKELLGDQLENELSYDNYNVARKFLKGRFADIIDKYGIVQLDEQNKSQLEIINTLLELSEQYKTDLQVEDIYYNYPCGASYDVKKA